MKLKFCISTLFNNLTPKTRSPPKEVSKIFSQKKFVIPSIHHLISNILLKMIDRTLNGYTQFIETSQWFIFSHKILNLSAYVLFVWQPRARAFKKMSKNIQKFENNCVEPKLSLKRQIFILRNVNFTFSPMYMTST